MVHTKNDIGFCASIFFFVGILSYVPVNSQFTDLSCLQLQGDINIEPVNNAYDVVTSLGGSGYTRGESFQVILVSASASETSFRGILIQAKPVGSDATVGSFDIPDAVEYEYLICPGPVEGSLTNTRNSVKNIPAFFAYTPPADVADIEITFYVQGETGTYAITVVVTPDIPNPCLYRPCENGGTCDANPPEFTCRCTSSYTGVTCATRVIYYPDLVNGIFRLERYVGFTNKTELEYIFKMVPNNSMVDIYIGGGISFQIGNGDQSDLSGVTPGQYHASLIGDTFSLQLKIPDIIVPLVKSFIGIYQFFFEATPQLQIPSELLEIVNTSYVIVEAKPGSIINVSRLNAAGLKYGTGRIVGDNEVEANQVTVRLSKYEKYLWFCLMGPVLAFDLIISQCDIEPCDAGLCAMGYCVPHNEVCDDYNCASLTATECAACFPNPCYNNGNCIYDTSLMSYSCQCVEFLSGTQCEDGNVGLAIGETFDLLSFSIFVPVLKLFYIHFTLDPGRQVNILQVQGLVAKYGLGPVEQQGEVDASTGGFFVPFTQFWVCLAPTGGIQRFRLMIS